MTIYYRDDSVTLHHGDCLEVVDWLGADVLVTDPPYGIGWGIHSPRRTARVHRGIANDHDTSVRDHALALWGTRPALVFGSWDAPFPAFKQVLVWRKPPDSGVLGSTTGYRRDTELIFVAGQWPSRSAARSSVLESNQGTSAVYFGGPGGHPHSKPVGLMHRLLEWTAGVVADPFAGSGSTLVAAKALGRKAVGVEIDERYCEIAARRLSQGVLDFEVSA